MTKEQIVRKINDYDPFGVGKLSYEQLIEVGLMLKQLPLHERSWEWLKQVTRYKGTADSLRCKIKNYTKTHKYHMFDGELDEECSVNSYIEKRQEIFKERQKLRDERTNLNRTLRDEARLETFKDYVKEVASTYYDLPECEFDEYLYSEQTGGVEAVFGLADLHLGLEFENSYNKYNYEIAKERIHQLTYDIIDYCHKFNVNTLHVLNLGDLVSGVIHTTLRLDQEYDVVEQIMRASEIVAEFVNKLQEACPNITYRSVVDNHSRITADKHQHLEKENLNRIIDWFVEERLKDTNVQFMKDNLDIGIGRIRLMNGRTLMFMHGHEDKKSSVMQDMVGLTKEVPDYILMAHYHNSAEHTFQGTKVYITGSIIGTDPYAYSHRLFGDPEQKLLVFDGSNVIDININLR